MEYTDESVAEYLQFVEDVSKCSNGGLTHLRIKNKVVRACENVEKPEHCPVKLYKKYISHVPSEIYNSFYLRPGGRERLYCFPLFGHDRLMTTSVTSHSNESKLSFAWLV